MADVSVTFAVGSEQATVILPVDLPSGSVPLSGDVSGTFGDCFVAGDLNLVGDLFIEGTMTGIDTFHVEGNGFTVFFQNGGRADLHGRFKAPWGPWGSDTTGWVAGDRLAVAPTAAGVYVPSELVWSDWSMARPVNSSDVTLVDGSVAKPEVVNLSQSIVFENLSRGFHFHDSAGVASLSDVKFLNCGVTGVLSSYPVHFHLLGDNSRGSLLERVVVEGGKNHAFVPHGSHGITFDGCVAYNVKNHAYWWDPPIGGASGNPDNRDKTNDSHDIAWDRCLAMHIHAGPVADGTLRLPAFYLTWGEGNRCVESVATCVHGGSSSSGFTWPETGSSVWLFQDCLAHNNERDGIFTWQNQGVHPVERFTAYRNGKAGIEHGAYRNQYHYDQAVLTGNTVAMRVHALSKPELPSLLFNDILTDGPLEISKHNQTSAIPVIYRRCTFTAVLMRETTDNGVNPGPHQFEDCGLVPADFDLAGILAGTVIEIFEGGVLAHRWAAGVWS